MNWISHFVLFHMAIVQSLSWHVGHQMVLPYDRSFAAFGQADSTFCGPSPDHNSMDCLRVKNGHVAFEQHFPQFGMLSATPIFYADSWIFPSAHGFLWRVKADPKSHLPLLNSAFLTLWGAQSRTFESSWRPHNTYTVDGASPIVASTPPLPPDVIWIVPTSSPFIGRLVEQDGILYALSANQYVEALNVATGELKWSVRLVADASLQLKSTSLVVLADRVVVGTTNGSLLMLDRSTGRLLNQTSISPASQQERQEEHLSAPPDRFLSIAAPPLMLPDIWVVSNADSITEALSTGDHPTPVWRYPVGSVITPLLLDKENAIVIGGIHSQVIALDRQKGTVLWHSVALWPETVSLLAMRIVPQGLLVAGANGQLALLDSHTGQELAQTFPIGSVVASFFTIGDQDSCLSFMDESVRCFEVRRRMVLPQGI